MDLDARGPRRRRVPKLVSRAIIAVGLSGFLAAFTASQIRLFLRSTGSDSPWGRLFFGQLLWWLLWGGLAPLVVRLSRRYSLDSGRLLPRAVLHLVLAAAFGFVQTALRVATLPLVLGTVGLDWAHEMTFAFSTYFHWNLLIYALLVAGEHAWRYRARSRERELETSRLEERLARAELEALRAKLNPHFLFNALSSVAELIHESPEKAEQTVVELSELLRAVLRNEDAVEVALEEELGFVERYLRIEKLRFEGRLLILWNISPDTLSARVPRLVLQPLVENAVRHGLAARPEGGKLEITSVRRGAKLELMVTDDGVGLGRETPCWRVGLDSTRARLEHLYDVDSVLALEPRPGGGAIARIVIPYRGWGSP